MIKNKALVIELKNVKKSVSTAKNETNNIGYHISSLGRLSNKRINLEYIYRINKPKKK